MSFNPDPENPFTRSSSPNSSRATNGVMDQGGGQFSLIHVLENLFYFRWYFLVVFLCVFIFSVFNALLQTPIFIADSLVQVQERKGSSLGGLSQLGNGMLVENQNSTLVSEIEILRSRTVIGQAVQDLKLNIQTSVSNRLPIIGNWLSRILVKDVDGLSKPLWGGNKIAWGGESLIIGSFTVPQNFLGRPFSLVIGSDRNWNLRDENGNILIEAKGVGQQELGLNGKIMLRLDDLKARPGTEFKVTVNSTIYGIYGILGSLTAAPAQKGSNLLKLTYEDPNPERAAIVLNAITSAYVQQNINSRSEEAKRSLEFLKQELPKLKANLEVSENELNDYRNENKSLDLTSEVTQVIGLSGGIEKQRMELELKRRQLSLQYQPDHPLLKALNSQLAGLSIQADKIDSQINNLPQVQQDYIRKTRDVEVNSKLYVSLLNNAQQLELAKAGTVGTVAVIDSAFPPGSPVRPNKPKLVSLGALLGLILGFLTCQLLAFITGIVRDPKTLEKSIGIPVLSILPVSVDQLEALERQAEDVLAGYAESPYLLAEMKPVSAAVEALRTLRTSILFSITEKPRSKVIIFTSAVPSQGKSFISANLAYLFGVMGKKTLLIEADVRRASLKRYLSFDDKEPGLSSILLEDMTIQQVIKKDLFPNLDFISAGPRVKNPGDMLSTDKVKNLIDALAKEYDYVLIDSPPLLPVNDARALSLAADLILFVVRQDMVSSSEIREALEIFNRGGSEVDGLIFNGYIPSRVRYGYNYGANYWRYGKKYGKYGYGNYGPYKSYEQSPQSNTRDTRLTSNEDSSKKDRQVKSKPENDDFST